MIQTYFELDKGTANALSGLKKIFKTKTSVGALRKAIALARICARQSKHGAVTLVLKDKKRLKVMLKE